MSPPGLEARGLSKAYGGAVALAGVDVEAGPGRVLGILGPNGAGKTTLLECLLGLRRPDAGFVDVLGLGSPAESAAARARIGALPQTGALPDRITPLEALGLQRAYYAGGSLPSAAELLRRFGLADKARSRVESLSAGQRRRLSLAMAMAGAPSVLVLDEPTEGLDPAGRREFGELVGEWKAAGCVVVLTTHLLEEAGRLCDRVLIMNRGRAVALASPAELRAAAGSAGGRRDAPAAAEEGTQPSGLPSGEPRTLEEVFLALTGGPSAAAAPAARPHRAPKAPRSRVPLPWRALASQTLLNFRLNCRNRQALVYGYLVPLLFLAGFAGIFDADKPPLRDHMGTLIVIAVLGGACFGLPTGLVSDRERGVWRLRRLLPVPLGALLGTVLVSRLVIVATSACLQIAVARLLLGTPLPAAPWTFAAGFVGVAAAFMGLGLAIAAAAADVPAVQAIGQCLFLPMIILGGVGVPLEALPRWAQRLSCFMPGRYAVQVLEQAYLGHRSGAAAWLPWAALTAIGAAAGGAGLARFRWEAGLPVDRVRRRLAAAAFLAWLGAGAAALAFDRWTPPPAVAAYSDVREGDIAALRFDGLPFDTDLVTPMAAPFGAGGGGPKAAGFAALHAAWRPPDWAAGIPGSVRLEVNVAALADMAEDVRERQVARWIYDRLRRRVPRAELRRSLAWIALAPDEGRVLLRIPALGLDREPPEGELRRRMRLYALKYLGKIDGRLPD